MIVSIPWSSALGSSWLHAIIYVLLTTEIVVSGNGNMTVICDVLASQIFGPMYGCLGGQHCIPDSGYGLSQTEGFEVEETLASPTAALVDVEVPGLCHN